MRTRTYTGILSVLMVALFTGAPALGIAPCGPQFAVPQEVAETTAGVVGEREVKIVPQRGRQTYNNDEVAIPISFSDLAIPGHSTDLDANLVAPKILNLFYQGHEGQSAEEDAKMRLDVLYVLSLVNQSYHSSNNLSMLDSTTSRDFDVVGAIEKDARVHPDKGIVDPSRALETRMWMTLTPEQRQEARAVAAGGYRAEEAIQERRELAKVISQSTCLSSGVVQALANMKPEMHGEDEVFRKPLFTDADFKRLTAMEGEHGEYIMRADEHWKGSKFKSLRKWFRQFFSNNLRSSRSTKADASVIANDRSD